MCGGHIGHSVHPGDRTFPARGRLLHWIPTLVIVLCATPTWAQTRLYILVGGHCVASGCDTPGRLVEVDIEGRRLLPAASLAHAGWNVTGLQVTADGRHLLWGGGDAFGSGSALIVSAFDTTSRRQGNLMRLSAGSGVRLTSHPSAVRAFLQTNFGEPILVMEPGGVRPLPSAACDSPFLLGRSGDGSRLFLSCRSVRGWHDEVIVVASDDGRLLGTAVGGLENGVWGLAVNDNGTELYVVDWDAWESVPGTSPVLRRYDVATGNILAERVGSASDGAGWLRFNDRTGQLYVEGQGRIHVLDGETLASVGVIDGPPGAASSAVLDPTQPAAYVVWLSFISGAYRTRIAVVDTTTFATLAEADLPIDTHIDGIALGPRPPRAQNLSAAVAGTTVTLQWTNEVVGPLATEIRIEAGSAPGLVDVARLRVASGSTSLAIPDVPRGTYFVRVRSANGTGSSEPSNEIIVVVP